MGRPNLAEVLSKRSATMIGAKRTQKILDSDTPEMTGNAPCRASKHGPTTLSFLDIMPNKFQKEQSLHGRMKPFACGGFAFHLPEWSTFGSWGGGAASPSEILRKLLSKRGVTICWRRAYKKWI